MTSSSQRYSRQSALPLIGERGQEKLRQAWVDVSVGDPCGVATATAAFLAGAGVGTLNLCGDLQRKVSTTDLSSDYLLGPDDIGLPVGQAIAARLAAINPFVEFHLAAPPQGYAAEAVVAVRLPEALYQAGLVAQRTLLDIVSESK